MKLINRLLQITKLLFVVIALFCGVHAKAQSNKQPNIVWIVCEDISPYISAYGNTDIETPNIDQLAKNGVKYTHVFTTAGVCAPSRSAIITGMYQTSIGTQHMRTGGDAKYTPVAPYSAVIPEYVKCFPEFLRKSGYYCTNNQKQDYQFEPPVTVWDANGPTASFRNRPAGVPFFSVFNLAITHESMIFLRKDSLLADPDKVTVPPIYPDTKIVRGDIARLYTNIKIMDRQVGEIISLLKADHLYDNTIIFFYSDHGGSLPWMKREILERGTHIPMVIHFPNNKDAGSVNDKLISAVDFAPTILSLAGVEIPKYMQGQAFLGQYKAKNDRQYVFAARDRMDTEYDRVRMVRDKQYRYLYNYMPDKPYYQNIEFRLSIPMMKEFLMLRDENKLDSVQMKWFGNKPKEELYEVNSDPYELKNLATNVNHQNKLNELRGALEAWTNQVGDMGALSEQEMIKKMWNGRNEPPQTEQPEIQKVKGGVKILCKTAGASIGYHISNEVEPVKEEEIQTWDFAGIFGAFKNIKTQPAPVVWKVYTNETIPIHDGDVLTINAMRIGFKASVIDYTNGKIIPKPVK